MFELKRTFYFAVAASCLVMIAAGCRSSAPRFEPLDSAPPPVAPPASPVAPPAPPADIRPIPPKASADTIAPNLLAWDAEFKTHRVQPGEEKVDYTFSLTNVSREVITIYDTSTSCDCTIAKLPAVPWPVAPGGTGQIQATVDLRNKYGSITNYVVVFTSKGNKLLLINSVMPSAAATPAGN